MAIKKIRGKLPWSDKADWLMPTMDRNIMDFPFRVGPVDLDAILPMLEPLLGKRRTCIQAGGCVGVWPLRLSQMFDYVITLEPEPTNFECMVANLGPLANVKCIRAALWSTTNDLVDLALDRGTANNCGAYFVKTGQGKIPTLRIDDLGATDVDLLCLDVEGAEYDAIQGGAETISKHGPVIAMEDKKHHGRYDRPDPTATLCADFGYRVIGHPTPWDVVLARNPVG